MLNNSLTLWLSIYTISSNSRYIRKLKLLVIGCGRVHFGALPQSLLLTTSVPKAKKLMPIGPIIHFFCVHLQGIINSSFVPVGDSPQKVILTAWLRDYCDSVNNYRRQGDAACHYSTGPLGPVSPSYTPPRQQMPHADWADIADKKIFLNLCKSVC